MHKNRWVKKSNKNNKSFEFLEELIIMMKIEKIIFYRDSPSVSVSEEAPKEVPTPTIQTPTVGITIIIFSYCHHLLIVFFSIFIYIL
ncbi:hypothetical protein M1146_06960 [Patescibacteria group bacterium]|nr:hypothetical protein [Patescibacteria group bacterium]